MYGVPEGVHIGRSSVALPPANAIKYCGLVVTKIRKFASEWSLFGNRFVGIVINALEHGIQKRGYLRRPLLFDKPFGNTSHSIAQSLCVV